MYVLLYILLGVHYLDGLEVFRTNGMSPSERNAWIHLGSILVVFIPYFMHVARLFEAGGPVAKAICIAFIGAALAHAVLNVVGQTVVAVLFGRQTRDERDSAIDGWSLRVAYFSLITLLLGALGTFAFIGAVSVPSAAGRILLPTFSATSQYVFFAFVVAEALRHATRVVCYRYAAR